MVCSKIGSIVCSKWRHLQSIINSWESSMDELWSYFLSACWLNNMNSKRIKYIRDNIFGTFYRHLSIGNMTCNKACPNASVTIIIYIPGLLWIAKCTSRIVAVSMPPLFFGSALDRIFPWQTSTSIYASNFIKSGTSMKSTPAMR